MPLNLSDIVRAAENFRADNPMAQRVEVFLNPEDFQSIQREYQLNAGTSLAGICGYNLRSSPEVQPGVAYLATPPEFVGTFFPENEYTALPEVEPLAIRNTRALVWTLWRNASLLGITPDKPAPKKSPTLWERLLEEEDD